MSTTWDSRPELPAGAPPPPEPPQQQQGRHPWPLWPWWTGLLAVPAAIVVANILGLIVIGIGIAFGDPTDDPGPATLIVATIVQDIVFVGTAIAFALIVFRPRASSFGLRGTRFWPAVGWTALTLVVVYLTLAALAAAFGVDPDEEQDNILESLGVDKGSWGVYVLAFVVCVLAPLAEEFLFRGFMFPALASSLGVAGGAILTGVVFGAIHITNYVGGDSDASFELAAASLTSLMILGALLCVLYWRTKSLLPCIALHAINNSFAFGAMQGWGPKVLILLALSLATCGAISWLAMRYWRGPQPLPA